VARFLEHGCQFVQVSVSEFGGRRCLLQQPPRALDEHVTEQCLVFREYSIEDGQQPSLSVADLVDQAPAQAGQFAQLQDRLIWHIGRSSPPNAYRVGNQPGVLPIALELTQRGPAVGMRLKWVKDLDRVPCPHQLVVQRQPVVAGSFQADRRWLVPMLQVVQQGMHAESRVAEAAWLADLLGHPGP